MPVESFFSSLKNESVRHRQFQNQAEARYAIAEYIEYFYNRQRLHQALGYRSPEESSSRSVSLNPGVRYFGVTSN